MDDMDDDMEMMDMEELELLEASYHLHDDDDFVEQHQPPEDFIEQLQPPPTSASKSPPPSLTTETPINGHKRLRSADDNDAEEAAGPSDEKRSKIDDEDWLQYSPPPPDPTLEEKKTAAVAAAAAEKEKQEKIVSRYASEIDGDFVPVTAPGLGDRVYAKISRAQSEERSQRLNVRQKSGGLLQEPISVLLQRLEKDSFTRALQASSKGHSDVVLPERTVGHERLWVDKYAPHSFTELLSDEQTNREVVVWLKQWDSSVFGSEKRRTSDEVLSALKRHSSITQHKKNSDSKFSRYNKGSKWNEEKYKNFNDKQENTNSKSVQELLNKSRSTGPPEHKILLLCGPPGLGKTTLAHVAAKHCGYHVEEVNASDDRSSKSIEDKIENLHSDSVKRDSSVDRTPKCLVIDEIDGARGDGKGAVESIIKKVSADKKSNIDKENISKEQNSGKASSKKRQKSLPRPIICICNDLYAPSLRPLREVAKVHVFPQPSVNRVVSRLKYICNKEGMKTSSIALTALAEHTDCDIRSCLNTLQFLNKKKESLNHSEIGSQVVGQKDMSKGVFDVWKEIFQKRKPKGQQRTNNIGGIMSNEFDSLHACISRCGDYDLVVDGLHENFLHLPYHDPVMHKTVKCLDSLGVSDLMNKYIMRTQQMSLYAYQPAIAIIVHRLVAQVQRPKIEWPKSYYRYRTILMSNVERLKSWYNKIPPSISRHLSINSFVEDSISLLLHILSPPTLRLAALHLLSEKEKNDLAQLVSTMVSYSITHRCIKSDNLPGNLGQHAADLSELSFDPPINGFINFQGYRSCHYVLASTMKQMLAHEVEKQRILQAGFGRSAHLTDGYNEDNQASLGPETKRLQPGRAGHAIESTVNNGKSESMSNGMKSHPSSSNTPLSTGNTPAKTKSNPPGSSKRTSSSSSSFFDRFRKLGKGSQNTAEDVRKEATSERDSRPLIFKFNEGYTNAVKRPVRIREFLS